MDLFEHRGKPDPAKVRQREEAHKRGLARSKHAREAEKEREAARRQREAARRKRELELKLEQKRQQSGQKQQRQQREQSEQSQKQQQQQKSEQQQQRQQQQRPSAQQRPTAIQRQQAEIEAKKKANNTLRTVHSNNEQVAQSIIELEQKAPSESAQEVGKQLSSEIKQFKQQLDNDIARSVNDKDGQQIDIEQTKTKTKRLFKQIETKHTKDKKLSKSDSSWLKSALKKTEDSLIGILTGVGSLMGYTDVYNAGKDGLSSIFTNKH